jgi:hypothetical protein
MAASGVVATGSQGPTTLVQPVAGDVEFNALQRRHTIAAVSMKTVLDKSACRRYCRR